MLAPFTSHPYDIACWAIRAEWAYIFNFNPLYHTRNGIFEVGSRLMGYPIHIVFSSLGLGNILTLQLALKIPYIISDVGISFLLYRLSCNKTKSQSMGCLLSFAWLVNPFTIFVSSIHGMNDPLPVFFTLLAVYFLIKNKIIHSSISLSIAACLKYYAFFLLPLFVLYILSKFSLKEKILSVLSFIIVAVVNFAPIIANPFLRVQLLHSFSYYSTGTIQMISRPWSLWHYFITIGALSHLSQFMRSYIFWLSFTPLYALVIAFICYKYKKQGLKDLDIIKYMVIILLLIPLFNPFCDPNWLLWALPLMMYISVVLERRLKPLVSVIWALNLIILIFYSDTQPIRYLSAAFPKVLELYPWPRMDYLATTFSLLYGLLVLTTIFILLGISLSLDRKKIQSDLTAIQIVLRNWKSTLICVFITLSLFATIQNVSLSSFPSNPYLREWVYYRIFSCEPTAIDVMSESNIKEFTFNVDAVHFFSTTTWEGARTYVRFLNLPDSALITINGQNIDSFLTEKKNIPFPKWVVEGAEFVEIPNIKKNLKEKTLVKVSIRESITEFEGIINGDFENGSEGWQIWPRSMLEVEIDGKIKKFGNSSLVLKNIETNDYLYVYQEIKTIEKKTFDVEAWMRIKNVKEAHFKISYHDKEGKTIRQDFQPLIDGTRNWWQMKYQICTPPRTKSIRIWCIGGKSLDGKNIGITWFDNINVSIAPSSIKNINATIINYFDIENIKTWWLK